MQVRLLPQAEEEPRQATAYYLDRSIHLAERFIDEVAKAVELLQEFPRLGAPVGTTNARRLILKTFPYQFIYRVEGDIVRVYAVAHLKRRPGYWRPRLPESQ